MTINLLPWRERQATRQIRRYATSLLISIILFLFMVLGCRFYLNHLKNSYQLQNLHLSQLINAINVPDDETKLKAIYQNTAQQIKLIQTVNINQTHFWREFAFLQQHLPNDMQLTNLIWAGKKLHIEGTTVNAELIGTLINNLENSRLFSQVTLDTVNKENQQPIIRFAIDALKTQESS